MVSCGNSSHKKDENTNTLKKESICTISKSDTLISKNKLEITKEVKKTKSKAMNQRDEMFCVAINHFSTAPFYVVINVKNLKTGQVKEVCTEAPSFLNAIDYQYTINNFEVACDKFPNQYIELSTKKALKNINYYLYTKEELEEYSKTIIIELIVQHVKEGKLHGRTFGYDYEEFSPYLANYCSTEEVISKNNEKNCDEIRKEQIMFAHIMYNNGIMMTRGCVAGNTCALFTLDQAKKH